MLRNYSACKYPVLFAFSMLKYVIVIDFWHKRKECINEKGMGR
jgi:hypothetical protein